jgi:DNA-binding MarR family transcriptional regulator
MTNGMTPDTPDRVQWLSDLIRLEITLWERVDSRLRAEHDLPLAFFETLFFLSRSHDGWLRVGDLAQALRITVGGASKLVDRIERAELIRREPDTTDRRASKIALTSSGELAFTAASQTYQAEVATVLDAALSPDEQHLMHKLVRRLLGSCEEGDS